MDGPAYTQRIQWVNVLTQQLINRMVMIYVKQTNNEWTESVYNPLRVD